MLEIKDAIKVLEMVDAYGIADEAKAMAIEALKVCDDLEDLGNFIGLLNDFVNDLCESAGVTNDVTYPPSLIIDYFKGSAQRVKDAGVRKCEELSKSENKPIEKPNNPKEENELLKSLEKLMSKLEKRP